MGCLALAYQALIQTNFVPCVDKADGNHAPFYPIILRYEQNGSQALYGTLQVQYFFCLAQPALFFAGEALGCHSAQLMHR